MKETEFIACPLCKESFPLSDLVVKSDAWLVREYDEETGTFIPVSVSTFDHTELQCPACGEDFQDGEIEDMIAYGSADTVEVS